MPSWSIHLKVAKEVNKKLKVNKDLFYYGNLIPDVDKNTSINRYVAHYYNENLPYPTCPKETMIDISHFKKDYLSCINNPLIMGYYCHILTDLFYNNAVYSKCWVQDEKNNIIGIKFKNGKVKKIDIEDKQKLKRKYKHKDFELYGKYLYNNNELEIPTEKEIILNNIKYLKNSFLNEELVSNRLEYLKNTFYSFNKLSLIEKIFKHRYCLFTKNELDSLLNECVLYVLKEIQSTKDGE